MASPPSSAVADAPSRRRPALNASPAAPFVRGGLAGVLSWLVIHPADVVKVRMQLAAQNARAAAPTSPAAASAATTAAAAPPGFSATLRTIARAEGLPALYAGLSAALTRQVTYTTLRLGLYASLRDALDARPDAPPPAATKLFAGIASGAVASAVATPVEVSMVRMYNDGAAAPAARRGYRNIADALVRIARDEGVAGLWRGATPTVVRSMVVNCVQLGTYDQAKEVCMGGFGWRDGVGVHLAASTTSGLCYSVATLPIDSAKTRLQNQLVREDGSLPYRNLAHAIVRVAREEGVLALWRGFTPYFSRCAGHTVAMFLVLEQVKKVL